MTAIAITPATRLRDLDRVSLWAACQGRCRCISRVRVAALIARYGLDARLAELAPRFRCTRCGGSAELTAETMQHRPCGDQPFYH